MNKLNKKQTTHTPFKAKQKSKRGTNLTPQCCKKSTSSKLLVASQGISSRKPSINTVKVSQYTTSYKPMQKETLTVDSSTRSEEEIGQRQRNRIQVKKNEKTMINQLYNAEEIINKDRKFKELPIEEHKRSDIKDIMIKVRGKNEIQNILINPIIRSEVKQRPDQKPLINIVRTTTVTMIPVLKYNQKTCSISVSSMTQQPSMISIGSSSSYDITEAKSTNDVSE